ncbi:putative Integrase [Novosphingobium sp. KN65.2]|nr:putative Integrase [Novosphingobium sp. KN65.2]
MRTKRAKGRTYYYWARTEPWSRLPNPYDDPDGFMRAIARLQRIGALEDERTRTGTFGGLVAAYRKDRKYLDRSASTRANYDHYLSRLLAAYASAPLRELTREDIQTRVMDANQDTPGAADMMLSILRNLYKFAVKRHRGIEDWTLGVEPYGNQSEREPWPDDLLALALASENASFRRAVALTLYTGQRVGDVCSMTWGMIRADALHFRQQKTKAEMVIPLYPKLSALVSDLPRSDRHLFLLSNEQGGPLIPDTFGRWCRKFCADNGHERRTAHGLRKNATIELFEAGCTTAEVAAITGHKSLGMLDHYGKKRSQPKIARLATAKWQGAETKREREN